MECRRFPNRGDNNVSDKDLTLGLLLWAIIIGAAWLYWPDSKPEYPYPDTNHTKETAQALPTPTHNLWYRYDGALCRGNECGESPVNAPPIPTFDNWHPCNRCEPSGEDLTQDYEEPYIPYYDEGPYIPYMGPY